jgi:molybdopterin synthase catalytic subunit
MILVQHADFNAPALTADLRARAGTQAGALVSFTGYVRDYAPEISTRSLFLEHYPGMCERVIADLLDRAHARWRVLDATVVHRVGELHIGEQIVFVGVISAHRSDAFDACHYIMDMLKTEAPLWKKETLVDGQAFWVSAREQDDIASRRWLDPAPRPTKDSD